MKTLLIDDRRNIDVTRVARTFDEGMKALKDGGWSVLYLDHDLGDPDPRHTGYDIICWIEANPDMKPDQIVLVTDNPVGRRKMQVVIDKLYGN